ncbi:DUF1697 domain-containing protein [Ascidiimonas aurantiaca]|uniref:DUF1697 domain-containing protein n=1 Tax=Ascidiimonas aurantiaca TaxID=1685432 RepID=UPI0030EF9256
MNTYVVLLRGINVSGHKLIKMDFLRTLLGEHGFKNVRTYIQSGNIVLETPHYSTWILETELQSVFVHTFGYEIPMILFPYKTFEAFPDKSPYQEATLTDTQKIYVTFLKEPPSEKQIEQLYAYNNQNEQFTVIDRAVFVCCEKDGRKLKYSNHFLERLFKTKATTRNLRTVQRIARL